MTGFEVGSCSGPPRWVRWLHSVDAKDINVLGSKVAHLGALAAAGIPTPGGFAVGADAYVSATTDAGVARELNAALGRIEDDPSAVRSLCAACRDLIREMEFPDELEREVTEAYNELMLRRGEAFPRVAVRSSAIKEDGVDSSGAGQYATVLGVSGSDGVLSAIRECWASLFSEHAVLYRHNRGIQLEETPMAVGIIELVDARASGVAFSIHPVSGNPSRLVIESTFGWGESLVQGHVTPDHYEVAREDLNILARRIGSKQVISTWSDDGGGIVEREMPEILKSSSSLDDEELADIAAVLLKIEAHFGYAVDVEWVWPRNSTTGPVIVQARPETVHRLTADQLTAATAQRTPFDPLAFAMAQTFRTTSDGKKA